MVEEESAACNSIANGNCSVYSYSSVARFGSALHQKHWHWKHLRWAPEQRRVPKWTVLIGLNVHISNDMLGTHPKGGHSASTHNAHERRRDVTFKGYHSHRFQTQPKYTNILLLYASLFP